MLRGMALHAWSNSGVMRQVMGRTAAGSNCGGLGTCPAQVSDTAGVSAACNQQQPGWQVLYTVLDLLYCPQQLYLYKQTCPGTWGSSQAMHRHLC